MLDPSWVGAKWHELGASYAQVGPSSLAFCQLKAKDRQVWPLSALVGPSRSLFFTPHPQLPNSSTSKSHPWPAQFQNNRGAGGIRREATWIRPPKQIRSLLLYHLFYIKITTNISHSSLLYRWVPCAQPQEGENPQAVVTIPEDSPARCLEGSTTLLTIYRF